MNMFLVMSVHVDTKSISFIGMLLKKYTFWLDIKDEYVFGYVC